MIGHLWAKLILASFTGLCFWPVGLTIGRELEVPGFLPWGLAMMILGVMIGLIVLPYLLARGISKIRQSVYRLPFSTIISGTSGLVVGLLMASTLSATVSQIDGWLGVLISVGVSLTLGSLGLLVGLSRERDIANLLPDRSRRGLQSYRGSEGRILMDTSAIIDGRIADISKTGFIRGTMIIPSFILDELRHIADSSDSIRRNRGRRGLEVLNKLRKESEIPIQISDVELNGNMEVDAKLVSLAKNMRAQILTTDFNLNKVADLQGIKVLNINELAGALKPVAIPGEEMAVRVMQEGKEPGQGIAYLDDGTMVVIDGGRKYINAYLDVSITRVLQTDAGRIIFAQPEINRP